MLVWILKTALLQSIALVIAGSLRHHSAVTRRRVLISCVIAVCVLPLADLWGPGIGVATLTPAAIASTATDFLPPAAIAGLHTSAEVRMELDGLAATDASRWPLVLALLWALGVALLSLRWAVGFAQVWLLCRRSSPVVDPGWLSVATRLASRPVRLLLSDRISTPMTAGMIRPLILLPVEARGWSESRLSMAIAHETAHIRRLDTLWINASLLLRAVQWANPLTWWFHRQLRLEMERSADEAVVGNGVAVHRYSRFLLDLATGKHPVTELAMARPGGMELRIRSLGSIASQKVSRASRWIGLVILGLSVGLGCLHANGSQDDAAVPSDPGSGDWQAAVSATAQQLREDHPGSHVRIGVVRVGTGELVATEGALDEPFGSGSAIKPLTVVAALEEGVPASTVLDCSDGKIELGGKEFRDHKTHGQLTVAETLARSSNVGTVLLTRRIPPERLFAWLEKLGVKTAGRIDPTDPAGAATGIALDLSVEELLTAYATIANGGANPSSGVQVIRPETAGALLTMLRDAVVAPGATGRRARVDGVAVAGKTGTTDRAHGQGPQHRTVTFVGLVPADQPRWVVAVAVDGARPKSYGGSVAAPAFASIVERAGRP